MAWSAQKVIETIEKGEDPSACWGHLKYGELLKLRRMCETKMDNPKGGKRAKYESCHVTAAKHLRSEASVALAEGIMNLRGSIDEASKRSTSIGRKMIWLTIVIAIAAAVGVFNIVVRLWAGP